MAPGMRASRCSLEQFRLEFEGNLIVYVTFRTGDVRKGLLGREDMGSSIVWGRLPVRPAQRGRLGAGLHAECASRGLTDFLVVTALTLCAGR